jgi:hypothetical protein
LNSLIRTDSIEVRWPRQSTSRFIWLQGQHRAMPHMQHGDCLADDYKQNPVCSPIATAVEQFADGLVECSAFGREIAPVWVLCKGLDPLAGTF